MDELDVVRPGGRRVRVAHYGNAGFPLILYFHGSPSSRFDIRWGEDRGSKLAVHVAAFDRPGYGLSDHHRFSAASVADDAVAVADQLGHDRFAVLGVSAGSVYAIATAAIHSSRVSAVGIGGGGAPYPEVPGALAELSEGERRGLDLIETDEDEAERLLAEPDRQFVDVLAGDDEDVLNLWRTVMHPADVVLLGDPHFGPFIAATHRESLRQGQQGWARDNVIRMGRWNLDLGQVKAPTWLWYGEHDNVSFGRWLEANIRDAKLVVFPDLGHFGVFQHWDAVVSSLLSHG
jgi:pimeloyl-ACP methyl ester carboxylesterase